MNIIKKIWNSPTLMTWGNLISSSLKLILLTPLILTRYNEDYIAFWYLLLTINSLAIVLDFGFYPTFSRIISYAFNGLDSIKDITLIKNSKKDEGKPNWSFLEKIYGTVNTIYFSLTFLVGILVFVFSFSPIYNIIDRVLDKSTLETAYFVFILSIVLNFLSKKFDSVLIGTNHVALINRWNIINNVLNTFTSICIVLIGLNVEWLAFNQLFFSVFLFFRNYFLERFICNEKFKEFKLFSFDKDIFKWVWNPVWQSGILIFASTGLTQATGLIYSTLSDSSQLVSYLLTLKLVTIASQFSQAPFYSKIPVFSGLRVKGKIKELSTVTQESIFKSLIVYVFLISLVFLFGDYALQIIGSKSKLENSNFIILMAFVWFFERHHAMHAQIFVTTNKVPFYKTAIISGLINLILIYLLLPSLSTWAFPVSYGVSNAVINNWWNVKLSLNSLNENKVKYFYKSAAIPLIILLLLATLNFLIKN
ncbi:hypothetical protein [Tenacibaculum insulae]|uniref:hypothetical protein n=1 Tax=Tenacibaculum insulae TaxID=2029677 RepID=UPI003AB40FEE